MKKTQVLNSIFSAILIAPLVVTHVKAVTITPNPTRQAARQEQQQIRVTLKKTLALAEIDRRITALQNLTGRINNLKKPTAAQKTALTDQVNAVITSLENLKTKINADTDTATLRTDKQSIVTSYRVFVFFIPKIQIIGHADAILELANEMQNNTTNTDALVKITNAQTQANNAINSLLSLSPDGYPDNKPILVNAREMVKTALGDLRLARSLMGKE